MNIKDPIPNILVFDSGIGGLSIVDHIQQQLPNSSVTYLADTKFFPYGILSGTELVDRVTGLISSVLKEYKADIVVIACNSASTLVLPHLRASLDIPVVGVVPAIKPAAQLSNSKVIGLLATPGTIDREYTDELIEDFARDCIVVRVGSNEMVEVVEKQMYGEFVDEQVYRDLLNPLYQHPHFSELDTMVLACTHFPLVKTQLSAALPSISHWVDSGKAIALRVKDLIGKKDFLLDAGLNENTVIRDNVLLTDFSKCNNASKRFFQNYGFEKVMHWRK